MRYADRTVDFEAALRDLGHANPRVRANAADALGSAELEDHVPRAREALRRALRDDRAEVRYAAALSLGELRDASSVDALCEQMEGDGHPMARQAATIALGMVGERRAVPALARALRDGAPDVRFQAATSLAQLDPAAALEPLLAALGDEDGEVRGAAAEAIGQLGDPARAAALLPLLDDFHEVARHEAALALAKLGDPRAAPTLARTLADRDPDRVIAAAEHLFRCPSEAVATTMRRFLARFLTPTLVKVWLAGALARLEDPQAQARLRGFLGSRRAQVRGLAIEVLGQLGQDWARALLEELRASPAGAAWAEELAAALDDASTGH